MLPDQFTKQIRCPLVLVQYLQSYTGLHQVNLPTAQITRREVSGMTWVSCGSSLANTAFYLAAGAAHGFWPVFSSDWLNVECQQASVQGRWLWAVVSKGKILKGRDFSLSFLPFKREKPPEIAAS